MSKNNNRSFAPVLAQLKLAAEKPHSTEVDCSESRGSVLHSGHRTLFRCQRAEPSSRCRRSPLQGETMYSSRRSVSTGKLIFLSEPSRRPGEPQRLSRKAIARAVRTADSGNGAEVSFTSDACQKDSVFFFESRHKSRKWPSNRRFGEFSGLPTAVPGRNIASRRANRHPSLVPRTEF